jgi:hypothetical protein
VGPVASERRDDGQSRPQCAVGERRFGAFTQFALPPSDARWENERDHTMAYQRPSQRELAAVSRSGLHDSRVHDTSGTETRVPSRFVLPATALR